jgi:RND family efflux transporter MFP subunit
MKRKSIYIIILLAIVIAIAVTLVKNKKELNKANTSVDRTNVPVTVRTVSVKREPMQITTSFPATIRPFDQVRIYAESAGMVTSLSVDLGDKVSKGQLLGTLDMRVLEINLKKVETDLKSLDLNRTKLKNDFLRAKDLYDNKAGLEIDMLAASNNYENAENNYENAKNQVALMKEQIRRARITAPIQGIISSHEVKNGEFVNIGTAIAIVTDVSRLKATVYVDQQLVYQLKTGGIAQLSSGLFSNRKLPGKIIYISPVADANHNYQIDLEFESQAGIDLKGGTDVVVTFEIEQKAQTLTIPNTALLTDDSTPYVYAVHNGMATKKTIVTGRSFGEKVEVLSGLQEQEQIIYSGQINLHEGSKIEIIKN